MVQYAVPNSDIDDGSWTEADGFGTDLFNQVDNGIEGGTPNDGTSIRNPSPSSSTCELGLQSLTDPDDDSNHIIRVRGNDFSSDTVDVDIYDGASFVDGTTFSFDFSTANYSYTLT